MPAPQRVVRSLQYRASPRFAYLDLHSCGDETVVVAGSRRSGTTWLAEVLNHRNEYRVLFEPLHPLHCSWARSSGLHWAEFVPPGDARPTLVETWHRLMDGRVRDPWIDKHNTKRVARRRIVKCVSCTNLMPWVAAHYPHARIVYLLRHPFAVSESQLDLSFEDDGLTDLDELRRHRALLDAVCADLPDPDLAVTTTIAASQPFEQHVIRWCLENRLPITMLGPGQAVFVRYEDLVADTAATLARLGARLGIELGRDAVAAAALPSRTDFRGRARSLSASRSTLEFLGDWRARVTPTDVARGLEVLRVFALDQLYGEGPVPLGSEVLSAEDNRSRSTA